MYRFGSRVWRAAACCLLVVVAFHSQASATITLKLEDLTIASHPTLPVTGYLDAYIMYDGGTPASIGAYNFRATLDGSAAGIIELETALETNGVVHPGHLPLFPGQDPLEFNLLPSNFIQVGDNLPGIGQVTPVADNLGLATLRFTVAPGATGSFAIDFNGGQHSETFLFTGNSDSIPIELRGGTITVVPEPSCGLWAALPLFSLLRRRSVG